MRAQAEAPDIPFDWGPLTRETLRAATAGDIDLAMVFGGETLRYGIAAREVREETSATFLRGDHPAIQNCGSVEAARSPYIQVIT